MAAELDQKFEETSHLIQSSGGVFEVESDGQLLFSKKELHRFPEDGEVAQIYKLLSDGKSLAEAQEAAGKHAKKLPSFVEWFTNKFLKA